MTDLFQSLRSIRFRYKVAAAVALLVALGIAIELIRTNTPSEGSSCVNSSEAEINAWVNSKSGEIPSGLSKTSIEEKVQGICQEARTTNEPQDFDEGLLHDAIEFSGG